MSANISLVDTPGVSAYFDGQPIQDQQEAELQREEERQTKELHHLLEKELEDFEDDFLSGSNSEDESADQSGASFSTERVLASVKDDGKTKQVSSPYQSHPAMFTQPSHASPLSIPHRLPTTSPGSLHDDSSEVGHQPQGWPNFPKHSEALMAGATAHCNPSRAPTSSKAALGLSSESRDHTYQHLLSTDYITPERTGGGEATSEGYDNRRPGSNQPQVGSDYTAGLADTAHPDHEDYGIGYAYHPYATGAGVNNNNYTGSATNTGTTDTLNSAGYDYNTKACSVDSGGYYYYPNTGASAPSAVVDRVYGGSADHQQDEWMMQIQQQVTSSYSQHPQPNFITVPHHHHHHHHHQQQQQQQYQDFYHHQFPTANGGKESPASVPQQTSTSSTTPAAAVATTQAVVTAVSSEGIRTNTKHNLPRVSGQPAHHAPPLPLPSVSPPPPPLPSNPPPPFQTTDKDVTEKAERTPRQSAENPTLSDHYSPYTVHYSGRAGTTGETEEDLYLKEDPTQFFHKEGREDQRMYEQLEILYRARGREIEDLTARADNLAEETAKEMRILKHKLAIANGEAEGAAESLRQSQKLLQQAKGENSEVNGKVKAMEVQLTSLRDSREELIKKLQTAESTVESLSHHIEELQDSESLSRARNEHEAVVSSLTQRYDRELLVVKGNLDETRANLESKQEEVVLLKKQLMEATTEREQYLISRSETINQLARRLEDSQKQCQSLLEHSSVQEMNGLKAQLQQAQASKTISDDLCQTFQSEIRELKEQLVMLETASSLGVFATSSATQSSATHNDSMTDLGIKKTLDFSTPRSVSRYDESQSSDELVVSLRAELEKCLRSNKQKRSEVAERLAELKSLKEEVKEAQNKVSQLEEMCAEQKKRLVEFDSISTGEGVSVVEGRMQREIENLKREKSVLLTDIEDYQKRLEEVSASEAKLTEINADLSHQISQMVSDSDTDKREALERCQRTLEEVNRLSRESLRAELEQRFEVEKGLVVAELQREAEKLRQDLSSAQNELDGVKTLYVKVCEESAVQEAELSKTFKAQWEEQLEKQREVLEQEKNEWKGRVREEQRQCEDRLKESAKEEMEAELKVKMDLELEVRGQLEQELAELREEKAKLENQLHSQELTVSELKLAVENLRSGSGLDPHEANQAAATDSHQRQVEDLTERHRREVDDMAQSWSREREEMLKDYEMRNKKMFESLGEGFDWVRSCEDFVQAANGMRVQHAERIGELERKIEALECVVKEKELEMKEKEKEMKEKESEWGKALKDLRNEAERNAVSEKYDETNNTSDTVPRVSEVENAASGTSSDRIGDREFREKIKKLELDLKELKQKHKEEVDDLRQRHKQEFEKVGAAREQKFQTELRYFLKQQGDKAKEDLQQAVRAAKEAARAEMETAITECKEKAREDERKLLAEMKTTQEELEKKVKDAELKAKEEGRKIEEECSSKFRCEKEKIVSDLQERSKVEVKRALEECERRLRKELKEEADKEGKREEAKELRREMNDLQKKLEEEKAEMMTKMKETMNQERLKMERSVKKLTEEKNEEILQMSLRHEEEEKKLEEDYRKEVETVRSEYLADLDKLRKEFEAKQADSSSLSVVTTEVKTLGGSFHDDTYISEEVTRRVREVLERKTAEANDSSEVEKKVSERVQEERQKWLHDAKEYIASEIRQGTENRLKEEIEKMEKESERKKVLENKEKKTEVDRRVKEKVEQEFANLREKFQSELEGRVRKEKSRLEKDAEVWKDGVRKRAEEEAESLAGRLKEDQDRKMVIERKKLEDELRKMKEREIVELRTELEAEMRKRIQEEKEGWREDEEERKRVGKGESNAEWVSWKEKLMSEVEARSKACKERDQAVELVKSADVFHRQEKHKLLVGLQKCREDLEGMKEEHRALEEKYAEMDVKYKSEIKEAKRRRELELSQLRQKLSLEQEDTVHSFKSRIHKLEEEFVSAMDRVKLEGEMERAGLMLEVKKQAENALHKPPLEMLDTESSTIIELRDQYLDTVAKIKEDVMSHVQEANVRAAATMRAEIRKQRARVIQMLKVKVKATLRSSLHGQVSASCISDLEHAIDVLSEHVVSTPTSGGSSDPHTPTSDPTTPRSPNSADTRNNRKTHHAHSNFNEDDPHQTEVVPTKYRNNGFSGNKEVWKSVEIRSQREKVNEGHFSSADSSPRSVHSNQIHLRSDFGEILRDSVDTDEVDFGLQQKLWKQKQQQLLQQQQQQQQQQQHPQLERVHLFDPEKKNNSPVPSNHSSPAVLSRTKSRSHSKKRSPSSSPNVGVRTKAKVAHEKAADGVEWNYVNESSPRDDMKVIEARVRLAKWASSGEMPWSASIDKSKKVASRSSPNLTGEDELPAGVCDSEGYGELKKPREQFTTDEDRQGGRQFKDGFLLPGIAAENWLRLQKEKSKSESKILKKKSGIGKELPESHFRHGYGDVSDDPAGSSDSDTSFVTLDVEKEEIAGSGFRVVSLGMDSGVSNSTPSNYNNAAGPSRQLKAKHVLEDQDELSMYQLDYERIKAAVLGRLDLGYEGSLQVGHCRTDQGKHVETDDGKEEKCMMTVMPGDEKIETGSTASSIASSETDSLHPLVGRDAGGQKLKPSGFPTSTPMGKQAYADQETDFISHRGQAQTLKSRKGQSAENVHDTRRHDVGTRKGREIPTGTMNSDLHAQQSNSLPKHSSRSRSAERGGADVLKSAELPFPSDLSRITTISDTHKDKWRYKSLEDLIPKKEKGREQQTKDARRREEMINAVYKPGDTAEEEKRQEGFTFEEVSADESVSVNAYRMRAPVQAMTSKFWEQQSEEEDEEEQMREERRRKHRPLSEENMRRDNGMRRREVEAVDSKGKVRNQTRTAPHAHKSAIPSWEQSGSRSENRPHRPSADDKNFRRVGFEPDMQGPIGSRSEPRHSKQTSSAASRSRGRDPERSSKKTHHPRKEKGSDHLNFNSYEPSFRRENRFLSEARGGGMTYFDDEISDLRKSLESLKSPASYIQGGKLSQGKMTRSTSEQSLHTIHVDRRTLMRDGAIPLDDIDALVSSYTAHSQFDLSPFANNEQF